MSDSGGLVNTLGNIPVGGIPVVAPITIRDEVHSGTELYHMVDRFFGGGLTAGQLHGELQPVCDGPGKGQLEHIRHVLNSASGYTSGHVSTELQGIEQDLAEAYQGAATSKMQTQFQKAGTLLSQLSPSFSTLAGTVEGTQTTLNTAWQVVKNYSRLHADESNVSSMNPFGGGDSDDDKAEKAWSQASSSLQIIGNHASGTNPNSDYQNITSTPYQPPARTNQQANINDPGSTGPGPGNFSPGPGPGTYHPGTYHPGHFHPGQPGPGTPGPGTYQPGPGPGYSPGGYGPGPGPGYGPGPGPGYGPGPGGPGGPGSGLDTGSDLSSAGPGPGPGFGGPGPGFGSGGGDTSGLGGASGPGAGSGAAGAAGGAGGPSAIPLGGRGGGGGGGGDGERERSTWLTEDDDVWGDSDAPDGVIS